MSAGDICLLRSSVKWKGIGYPALFDGFQEPVVYSGFIIRFRPNQDFWFPNFLTYLLRTNFVRQNVIAWATVSANININQNAYSKIPLPHPDLTEQKKIVSILSTIEKQIQQKNMLKSKLQVCKKGLIQKLLPGQIRVKI